MGAALATVVAIVAIVAPWLAWVAKSPIAIALFGAIALVASFHGWGLLVCRLARRRLDTTLAIWCGVAAALALGGISIAFHIYDARLIVVGGVVAHTAELLVKPWPRPAISIDRHAIVPGAVIGALAVIHILAAAGASPMYAFDDDGHIAGQFARLLDTGALGDAVGYARSTQLGGHLALSGLATALGGLSLTSLTSLVDALAFPLVLALALARIAPRDAGSALWTTLVILFASAATATWPELGTQWIAIGLVLALVLSAHADREDDAWPTDMMLAARTALPSALCAGALIALRVELVPVALLGIAYAWWRRRAPLSFDALRIVALVVAAALPVVGFAVARGMAYSAAHGAVKAIAAGHPAAVYLAWPIGIAGGLVVAIALGRRDLSAASMVLAALACVLLYDAREAHGRTRWSSHYAELLGDVGHSRRQAPEGGDYHALLARVPVGATIAVWVERPELLDYARHRIVDLRTPRTARLAANPAMVTAACQALGAHWLVVEDDGADLAAGRSAVAVRDGVTLVAVP